MVWFYNCPWVCKRRQTTQFQISNLISECYMESNINYRGDGKLGSNNLKTIGGLGKDWSWNSSWIKCRDHCDYYGAPYFTWGPGGRCYCKKSKKGRQHKKGDFSGPAEGCAGKWCLETDQYPDQICNSRISLFSRKHPSI